MKQQQTEVAVPIPVTESRAAVLKRARLFARKARLNPALLDRYKKPEPKA